MDDASLKPSGDLKHLKYLDSLRGIAILMVILVHSWIASGYVIPFFLIGQRGVQLFFIVSALTLMISLHTRQEPRRWSSYFVRRFFRIAPMFYLALVGNLILTASRGSQFNAGELLLGFTMMHGFSPELINHIVIGGWSIAVEVLFYLVLPLIFRWVKTLMASAVLLAVAASVCGFVSWQLAGIYPGAAEYFTFLWFVVEFPVFCAGILLYFAIAHIKVANLQQRTKALLSLFLTTVGVLGLCLVPVNNSTLYVSTLFLSLFVLGLSLVNWSLFVNRFLSFTGTISYSMYLIHFFVIKFVLHVLGLEVLPENGYRTMIIYFVLVTAITMPLSYVTWRYIETPFIKLGNRVVARMSRNSTRPRGATTPD